MAVKKQNKKKLKKKWLHKYRLVVLNEDTFEEQFAMKLTRLNVFIFGTTSAIILIFLTTVFIAFTPIREYIPGYSAPSLQKQAILLEKKTDSLYQIMRMNDRYIASIKKVLNDVQKFVVCFKDNWLDDDNIETTKEMITDFEKHGIASIMINHDKKKQFYYKSVFDILSKFYSHKNISEVYPPVNPITQKNKFMIVDYDKNSHTVVNHI